MFEKVIGEGPNQALVVPNLHKGIHALCAKVPSSNSRVKLLGPVDPQRFPVTRLDGKVVSRFLRANLE